MAFVNYTNANLAQGTLLAGISAAATSAILSTNEGGLFPSTFPFMVKIEQFTGANVTKREIVKCTARVGDTLTIVRSAGTCPASYTATTQTTTAFSFDPADGTVTLTQVITNEQILDIQAYLLTTLQTTGGTMTGLLQGAQGADIASATTTDLATATGNRLKVTGTTTITAFGTVTAGTEITITFTGALTLTHNATSLILPTAANITTVAGDVAVMVSLGSGNWKCTTYQRADGTAVWASTPVVGNTVTTFVAGENLTAGMPVYVSNGTGARTSGRVYQANSLDTTYTDSVRFIGFASETITSGNNIKITTAGIDTNQSGLTVWADYYLSDTVGTISTTPWTVTIPVGKAVSTTSILLNQNQFKFYPTIKQVHTFDTTTRYDLTSRTTSGTVTFGTGWASLDTTATANRSAGVLIQTPGGRDDEFAWSPVFSAWFQLQTNGTDYQHFVWIWAPSNGAGGITFTGKHIWFKVIRTASGTISLFATQADGTTETASSALVTITTNDLFEFLLKVNARNSVDYYYRKNGAPWSAATTLTANIPAAANLWCSILLSNTNVATQTVTRTPWLSYER